MLDSIDSCIIGFCFGSMMCYFAAFSCVDVKCFVNIYLSGNLFVYWFTNRAMLIQLLIGLTNYLVSRGLQIHVRKQLHVLSFCLGEIKGDRII